MINKTKKEKKKETNPSHTHRQRAEPFFSLYMFHYLIKGTEKLDGGVGEGDNIC